MLKIDNNLLQDIGLGTLPDTEKNSLLKHIYETLEMRVGMRLADQMTNEQLDEFERYFEAKDDAGAFAWLESNFPNYKDIVQEEFDKLKSEVDQAAPQILSAALGQAQMPPSHQPQVAPTQTPTPDPIQQQQYVAAPVQYSPTPMPQPLIVPTMPPSQPPAGPQQ